MATRSKKSTTDSTDLVVLGKLVDKLFDKLTDQAAELKTMKAEVEKILQVLSSNQQPPSAQEEPQSDALDGWEDSPTADIDGNDSDDLDQMVGLDKPKTKKE